MFCEGCISDQKKAVLRSVFAEGSFRTRSTGQDIHRIYIHIGLMLVLLFHTVQINFNPVVKSAISLISISVPP